VRARECGWRRVDSRLGGEKEDNPAQVEGMGKRLAKKKVTDESFHNNRDVQKMLSWKKEKLGGKELWFSQKKTT